MKIADETALPATRRILENSPENRDLISLWLKVVGTPVSYHRLIKVGEVEITMRMSESVSAVLIDKNGTLLGASNSEEIPEDELGGPFEQSVKWSSKIPVQYALAGGMDPEKLVNDIPGGKGFVIALPVYSESSEPGELLGVLAVEFGELPENADVAVYTARIGIIAVIGLFIVTGISALLFAYLMARGLTARLSRFSVMTEKWSRGDFLEKIDDKGEDEIGQLADKMDSMAGQMKTLLEQQKKTAVSEERQRMARDLHDSVKQQALAASFQISTAMKLLSGTVESTGKKAAAHLYEAEHLLDSVRRELSYLVNELYLTNGGNIALSDAIRTFTADWSQRNGIKAVLKLDVPSEVTFKIRNTLYRITQEALANTARHSNASVIDIKLNYNQKRYLLTIEDNGCGFQRSQVPRGAGLKIMKERAEALNGKLIIESSPDKGTRISVILPEEEQ